MTLAATIRHDATDADRDVDVIAPVVDLRTLVRRAPHSEEVATAIILDRAQARRSADRYTVVREFPTTARTATTSPPSAGAATMVTTDPSALIDELVALDTDLSVVAKERCAESAKGPAQSKLAVGLVAYGSDDICSKAMKCKAGLDQRVGCGGKRAASAEPTGCDPVGMVGVVFEPGVPARCRWAFDAGREKCRGTCRCYGVVGIPFAVVDGRR